MVGETGGVGVASSGPERQRGCCDHRISSAGHVGYLVGPDHRNVRGRSTPFEQGHPTAPSRDQRGFHTQLLQYSTAGPFQRVQVVADLDVEGGLELGFIWRDQGGPGKAEETVSGVDENRDGVAVAMSGATQGISQTRHGPRRDQPASVVRDDNRIGLESRLDGRLLEGVPRLAPERARGLSVDPHDLLTGRVWTSSQDPGLEGGLVAGDAFDAAGVDTPGEDVRQTGADLVVPDDADQGGMTRQGRDPVPRGTRVSRDR